MIFMRSKKPFKSVPIVIRRAHNKLILKINFITPYFSPSFAFSELDSNLQNRKAKRKRKK